MYVHFTSQHRVTVACSVTLSGVALSVVSESVGCEADCWVVSGLNVSVGCEANYWVVSGLSGSVGCEADYSEGFAALAADCDGTAMDAKRG